MSSATSHKITCPHCHTQYEHAALQRNCSNCFACTGCERYTCTHCKQEIVIQAVKQSYSKTTK